jgi:hypothetical protein
MNPKLAFEQGVTFLSKCSIAGELPTSNRLLNELVLFSRNKWAVERNMQGNQLSCELTERNAIALVSD